MKHSPDGTQPMADNHFLTTSSPSTTTGGISFAEDPRAFYNEETGTCVSKLTTEMNLNTFRRRVFGLPWSVLSSAVSPACGGREKKSSDMIRFSFRTTC